MPPDPFAPEPRAEIEFHLGDWLRVVSARWRLVALVAGLAVAFAVVQYAITPKEYRATSLIQIERRMSVPLRGIEDEVQKAFGVAVDDIVGASIHRFHRDKRRVERILRNPAALPHQAELTFGPITLQAKINGVFGPGNEVLGYIVNWEDVSQRQRMEAEQSRLASMLENAPTNCTTAITTGTHPASIAPDSARSAMISRRPTDTGIAAATTASR